MSFRSAAVMPRIDWSAAVRGRPRVGHALEVHESIGSTNDRARELLDEPGGDGGVVLAELQTEGRGRRGRTWTSPAGVNLMLSVALRPAMPASAAWELGLAAALALLAAARSVAPAASIGLKWPNDLVARVGSPRVRGAPHAKLAGLLVETELMAERLNAAVIGIGINVNWLREEMPDEIADSATSLAELAGEEVDRVALLDRLLDALDDEIRAVESGLSPLSRYRKACVTLGQEVAVVTPRGVVMGRAVDLEETGSLVVETSDGERETVETGDVLALRSAVLA